MATHADSDATRASLLFRAKQRESRAWHELVELYGPLIAHWCQRCGLDCHASADCVQQTFAAVLKSLSSYEAQKTSGAFRSWLWTIASNKIRDHIRSHRRQAPAAGGSTALRALQMLPADDGLADGSTADSASNTDPSESEQLTALLTRALEQIREEFEQRTWQIFQRSVVDQIPTGLVAEEFSISSATVRQVRSRILRRLRQQLGDIEP